MASSLQTGLSAASYQRYLRGPGKVYQNFSSIAVPGTLLGATKGGTEFSWGLEAFDIQPDGSLGLIKNHRVVNSCKPTMKVNFMEFTTTTMPGSVPGGDTTNETRTGINQYVGTGAEVAVGVGLKYGDVNGAIDENTLEIWETTDAASIPTKQVLDTNYAMLDTITCASVTADDTVTVGSVTYTAKATETIASNYFACSTADITGDALCATSLAACIEAATYGTTDVDGSASLGVVYCTRAVAGTPTTITASATATITTAFQVVFEITGFEDLDEITATYIYDSAAGSGVYQITTPGIIASTDYWTNVALVCELSNQTYSNPYIVYIVKNVLPNPDPVSIPGEYPGETALSVLYEGSFDPSVGLTMENAPVEAWIGRS